jgi:hypothetical protein
MKLKQWGFAALCVLSMHCSTSSPTPTGNSTSTGASSVSGSGGGGTGSGALGGGSGTSVASGAGGSGDTGLGSGSTAASGSLAAGDAGSCTVGVQAFSFAGCPVCGHCWEMNCCAKTNDCINDPTCNGYAACQANCYNGQAPDGGSIDVDAASTLPDGGTLADDCANNCLPPDAGSLWNVFQDCISPKCDNECLCP